MALGAALAILAPAAPALAQAATVANGYETKVERPDILDPGEQKRYNLQVRREYNALEWLDKNEDRFLRARSQLALAEANPSSGQDVNLLRNQVSQLETDRRKALLDLRQSRRRQILLGGKLIGEDIDAR
ncbi:MAG: hypothetical protein AAF205_13375 [Pseudomonadota bacterium]